MYNMRLPAAAKEVIAHRAGVSDGKFHWHQCERFFMTTAFYGWNENGLIELSPCWFNPLRPCHAYTRQWTRPSLVQIMACRLFGAKPLSEPMLKYCQLHPKGHILMIDFFCWRSKVYIKWNAFQNVVGKMAAMLLLPQYISGDKAHQYNLNNISSCNSPAAYLMVYMSKQANQQY